MVLISAMSPYGRQGLKDIRQWFFRSLKIGERLRGAALATPADSFDCHESIVRLLLQNSAQLDKQGEHGNALQNACYSGHEALVRLLLDHGARVNADPGKRETALQCASAHGNENIVELLLERVRNTHVNVPAAGKLGTTQIALHLYSNINVVKLFLEDGVDINSKGRVRTTWYGNSSDNNYIRVRNNCQTYAPKRGTCNKPRRNKGGSCSSKLL
jgi:ankyrin repeat protein